MCVLIIFSFLTKQETIHTAKMMGVVLRGNIPKELVGVKDSHYTIMPVTDAMGTLRFVMVILFAAKEISPGWSLSVDIFAEWDPDDEFNMGPGKCCPGISLISVIDGKEILILFAANPKASMTSTILMQTIKKMDKARITNVVLTKKEISTSRLLSLMATFPV